MSRRINGYTLIEFITVITIISILTGIFAQFSLYYMQNIDSKKTESEIGKLVVQLENHKVANNSYKGFPSVKTDIPNSQNPSFTIYVYDVDTGLLLNDLASKGKNWAIKGINAQTGEKAYLANSYGTRCYTENSTTTLLSCGGNSVKW